MTHVPWFTIILFLLALALYLGLGAVPNSLVYDRFALEQGEVWRLFTGHWVHSNHEHAFWNLLALLLLGGLFEKCLKWHLLTILGIGMLAVSVWLWWWLPSLPYYSGLSGILNSLLAAGLLCVWQRQPHWLLLLTGVLAISKIGLEVILQRGLFAHTDWVAVPQVHLVGFIAGLGVMWVIIRWQQSAIDN